jgi:hypothetical protein
MRLTIKKKIDGVVWHFWCAASEDKPSESRYVYLETDGRPGQLGEQITYKSGATIAATPATFQQVCRKWVRQNYWLNEENETPIANSDLILYVEDEYENTQYGWAIGNGSSIRVMRESDTSSRVWIGLRAVEPEQDLEQLAADLTRDLGLHSGWLYSNIELDDKWYALEERWDDASR